MSAVVGDSAPAGVQKYVNFDEYVNFQVNKTRSGIRHADLLQAIVTVLLVVAGYLLAFVVADQWLIDGGFAFTPRLLMLIGVGGFISTWTVWKIVVPYWKRITALYAARELEQSQPQLKSSLLTLVDLKRAERNIAPHILSAMEKRAALQLSQIDVDQAVDRRPLMRLAYALFAIVVAFCVYTVLSPKPVGASILRALIPVADVGVATRTRILNVQPGDETILARSQLEVTVDLGGEIPPEATLLYSTRDLSLVDEPVILRDTGEGLNRFRGTLSGPNGRGLLQDFTYHVAAGDALSETYRVSVKQAPYATVDSIAYAYPAYMGLDPKSQSGGDIDAWEGTQVTLRAITNMPVAGALLRLHDSEDTSLKAEERQMRVDDETHLELTLPWTLEFRSDGSYPHYYSIDVRTSDEQRDPVPRLYGLTIRRDLPPEIKLLHPSGDIELPANAVLPVSLTARDPDFMLRSVRMHFEKRDQFLERESRHFYDAPPSPFRAEFAGRSEIDLEHFGLQPGEVLTFWLEAWDNMAPLGNRPGNRSVTPKINISISDRVSPDQVEERRADEAAAAQQRLDEAQTSSAPETPDADAAPDDQSQDEPQTDVAAGDSEGDQTPQQQPGDPAADDPAAGEDAAANQQPEAEDAGGEQPDQSAQPAAGREPTQGDTSPNGQLQAGENDSGAGEQSQTDNTDPSKSANSGGNSGGQTSNDGNSRPQQSRSEPGQEAADDEALNRLFQKYADEIKQQQQQSSSDSQPGENEQSDENDGTQSDSPSDSGNNRQARQPQDRQSDATSKPGDSSSAGSDQPDDSSADPQAGSKSRTGSKPQDEPGGDNRPDGDSPSPADDRPPQQDRQDPRSNSDPLDNQDPRKTDDERTQRGRQPSQPPQADDSKPRGDSPPMPGQGEPSASSPDSEKPADGDSSPSGDPDSEQPDGQKSTGGNKSAQSKPNGSSDPDQPGDAGSSGADNQDPADPARTGGQPNGPDNSEPGAGRPKGQRSEQPSAGERGSSQQSSEGTPGSDQRGPGDPSQSPGGQSEAGENDTGKPSPGRGKPSGGEPGESQPGDGGSQSKPGKSGGSESVGGDQPDQSGSESGAKQPGNEPSNGGDQGESDSDTDASSQPGEDKPAGDDRQQPADPKVGNEGGGKEGGGKEGGGKEGGGKEGGGKEGGGKEGGGKEGGGKEGGGKEGGGKEGGGKEGGGKEGGGKEGGGAGGSAQQGNAQPGSGRGQPGSARTGGNGTGSDQGQQAGPGAGSGDGGPGEGAEAADLNDKKRATELVLRRLQDELSRGEVSQDLLQDLGWTEGNLREFMERLDRRLSDTGDDQSLDAQARRRQFTEILRGINYASEGRQQTAEGGDRPVAAGSGTVPRFPAPTEFQKDEESLRRKLSRETRSK